MNDKQPEIRVEVSKPTLTEIKQPKPTTLQEN